MEGRLIQGEIMGLVNMLLIQTDQRIIGWPCMMRYGII